jgi:hypothetical protein
MMLKSFLSDTVFFYNEYSFVTVLKYAEAFDFFLMDRFQRHLFISPEDVIALCSSLQFNSILR